VKPTRFLMLLWAIALALPSPGMAQWQPDGAAVSTATSDQSRPTIIPDGTGGAIITWRDYRSGTSDDIYVQRVNASGAQQWTANGVALCTAANQQYAPTLVSDGAGGAIVTWSDVRSGSNFDIYAQRVNASGVPQWTANGVALCTAVDNQQSPTIVSDGAGGAIVTWGDYRAGFTNSDIYAQRVNASGVTQWTANGVALCTAVDNQGGPTILSDGGGGAIVTWADARSGYSDIYAQRVNASGVPQWTANGVALCTATYHQGSPMIVSDGAGGAIVTWEDLRSVSSSDIYAQRVSASGVAQWTANGVALCTAGNDQNNSRIASDGAGGAIVTWYDLRSGNSNIYAQRVNASGVPQWTVDGIAVCASGAAQFPTIALDGAGGAIVTWQDYRSGTSYDIYAQRVNSSGASQWTADGIALCTAGNAQEYPVVVSDGKEGAIVAWQDYRSGVGYDIYAQRIGSTGCLGRPEPWITSASDIPGDQGGRVAVNWLGSDCDKRPQQMITHYSVWRAVDPVAFSALAGTGASPPLVDASATPMHRRGAAVRHERVATMDYYWEWVGNQDARYSASYSFSAATREDSVAGAVADHYFQVLAHTGDPYVFIESNVMGGHSVDNLAPAAPLALTALRVGPDVRLRWKRVRVSDLRDYAVYRQSSAGVTPVPVHFLASATDTALIDASAPATALYYVVTAYDVHENRSAPSNEASVGSTTGVGNTPPITTLTVLQNHPNPFSGTTSLEIGLPVNADLEIEVFDVAGRRVREMRQALKKAGWTSVPFDGLDDTGRALASGVYFCKIHANGTTITRKMVIAR